MLRKFFNKLQSIYQKYEFKVYQKIIIPLCIDKIEKQFFKYNVASIKDTAVELANTDKSFGRFGDGEVSWLLKKQPRINDFEHASNELSQRLSEVLRNKNNDFMVGLPGAMNNLHELRSGTQAFCEKFFIQNKAFLNYLDKNRKYYNTGVTRPYIDYNFRKMADDTFSILKKIWKNKKILIVEGNESRLGYNNDLFSNAKDIKRIECPPINAFESYEKILDTTLSFLHSNEDYITLIALGPTATVLSYDLFVNGYRAIDVGHIDVEYMWYLIGAKERINLPDRYVNEVSDGHSSTKINDVDFQKSVIAEIN